MKIMSKQKSFTLIELLVVIAIIGLLASIVLVSFKGAMVRGRTERAISDLNSLRKALEVYYTAYGSYPNSQGGAGPWDGLYSCWGDSTPNWIPGLAPNFIAQLPRAPTNITDCDKQYIYNSNGKDYKLIYHNPEACDSVKKQYPNMVDPVRDCWAYGFWTAGAVGW